jgi:type IV pilus assembly protein PilE
MKKQTGFTLLEIMVVVVLIAVLAAIGLPSYNDYILRSRLGEAYANLSDMSTKLEQYFQDQRTYNGVPPPCTAGGTVANLPAAQNARFFTITCSNLGASTYTVTATGSVANTTGFTFTVDQSGLKQTTTVPGSSGYTTSTGAGACWVRRKGSGSAAC